MTGEGAPGGVDCCTSDDETGEGGEGAPGGVIQLSATVSGVSGVFVALSYLK